MLLAELATEVLQSEEADSRNARNGAFFTLSLAGYRETDC